MVSRVAAPAGPEPVGKIARIRPPARRGGGPPRALLTFWRPVRNLSFQLTIIVLAQSPARPVGETKHPEPDLKPLSRINLTLFFTAGVGLRDWARAGNLERELALYHRLEGCLGRVDLVSYGGRQDREFRGKLGGLNPLPLDWRRRQELTFLELAARYGPRLLGADVLKTNQIRGAQLAIWASRLCRKKLIVRCGFLHSVFTRQQTDNPARIEAAVRLEREAFRAADAGIVTSAWQRELVLRQYGLPPDKVHIVPNYVITEDFRPLPGIDKQFDLLFIGRDAPQKNLPALFQAVDALGRDGKEISLALAGSCCDSPAVRELAGKCRARIVLLGALSTAELPAAINRARLFVLPSRYEGHPKVLLEAMSCGLACLGAEVEGIREELEHGVTGWLCETDPASIAAAVEGLLEDAPLRARLGQAARRHVVEQFDLARVVELESKIIQEVASR